MDRSAHINMTVWLRFFIFQAEDGRRDLIVTGVQTCALPIAAAIAAGFSRGVLLLSRDDINAAEATLALSLKLARQHEVHLFMPVLANQHGYALLQLGRIEDAR